MDPPGLAPGHRSGMDAWICRSGTRHQHLPVRAMSPRLRSGSRETRTHKRFAPPPVFKTGSRAPTVGWSQPDGFRPLSCGSWNRTNGLLRPTSGRCPEPGVTTNSNCSAMSSFISCSTTRTTVHGSLKAAGVGIEPTPPGSRPGITTSSDYPASFYRGTGGTRTRALVLNRHLLCR